MTPDEFMQLIDDECATDKQYETTCRSYHIMIASIPPIEIGGAECKIVTVDHEAQTIYIG